MDLFNKQYHTPGTMPGTLVEHITANFELVLVDYDSDKAEQLKKLPPEACTAFPRERKNRWVHVQGQATTDALHSIAQAFDIHALHLEDIVNTGQQPKLEIGDQQIFVILSLPLVDAHSVTIEQVCIFLNDDTVISFCTGEINPFKLIYQSLYDRLGTLRKRSTSYLFYRLIDTVIDHGFPMLEFYADRIEKTEETLIARPDKTLLHEVHQLRRELLLIRRKLWPQREVVNELLRDETGVFIEDKTRIYLRDCYDHTVSILELLETYREMTASMLEVYLSSVSHRLNEIIRVLTIISTLFIPPTFIVGLYGMNFDRGVGNLNMPELGWPYGYVLVWGIILAMTGGMVLFFRRKKWL